MSLPFLQTIGLTEKEAELYELLLNIGEVPAQNIIKESGLKRATAYKVLYSLEKKGLVEKKDIEKIIHFRPLSPNNLLTLAETQYQSLDRARKDLQTFLPQLSSAFVLAVEKPVVSTFEGVEGIKRAYEDSLRENKPIYAVLQAGQIEPEILNWLDKVYVKRRIKQKLTARAIFATDIKARQLQKIDKKSYRTSILVPKDKFPFEHEINIYGDNVAFINNRAGVKHLAVIIKHPQIAATMRAWFELSWEGAKAQTLTAS
jgi:sugar-specific transcriptional regulator TrmB